MTREPSGSKAGPGQGQWVFALLLVVVALALLAQIGDQTRWSEKTRLFAQPRFWPAVGLGTMAAFALAHLSVDAITALLLIRYAGIWPGITAIFLKKIRLF